MGISGVSGSTTSQLYQIPPQKSAGQVIQQAKPIPAQGPAEEGKESSAMQTKEGSSGGEAMESTLIDTYA
ncbi:hypothetical protein [uncultured Desulfobulbus sp.]|uniref:hypothetical protein n=1 Tax=uncultured Desulfobulbus sp. TaxID=239745 RepID=UPI0029C94FD9|nr:hypothetical protein [uncultured Desulfobulbus sp.]